MALIRKKRVSFSLDASKFYTYYGTSDQDSESFSNDKVDTKTNDAPNLNVGYIKPVGFPVGNYVAAKDRVNGDGVPLRVYNSGSNVPVNALYNGSRAGTNAGIQSSGRVGLLNTRMSSVDGSPIRSKGELKSSSPVLRKIFEQFEFSTAHNSCKPSWSVHPRELSKGDTVNSYIKSKNGTIFSSNGVGKIIAMYERMGEKAMEEMEKEKNVWLKYEENRKKYGGKFTVGGKICDRRRTI